MKMERKIISPNWIIKSHFFTSTLLFDGASESFKKINLRNHRRWQAILKIIHKQKYFSQFNDYILFGEQRKVII